MKRKAIFIFLMLILLTLVGCRRSIGFKYVEGKVNIVVTTTMIGDLVNEIGQEHVSVTTLMDIGVDPHSYVPRPSATRAISQADLVITNGLDLEAKMGKVLQMLNEEKHLVLGDFIDEERLIKDESGMVDPHVWFDIESWSKATIALKNKLITLDGENKNSYEENTNFYLNELADADLYIKEKVAELDPEKRVLITAHDGFSYFGAVYGFAVHSIQGISTESEASAKDIQELANLIVKNKVKAIFLESSIPENTIRSVIDAARIKGHSVEIGGTLYSDSLGDPNGNAGTYLKMVKLNADVIVESLK